MIMFLLFVGADRVSYAFWVVLEPLDLFGHLSCKGANYLILKVFMFIDCEVACLIYVRFNNYDICGWIAQ